MIIGRVTNVNGIKAVATFFEKLPPFIQDSGDVTSSPRLNSFVKTRVGFDVVICQIVGEHEFEYDRKQAQQDNPAESQSPFLVDLEVRGRISDGHFLGGLRCLPFVGARVETLDADDLQMLYSPSGEKAISLGKSLFDESCMVSLDANKLIPSHIGIFGNTGSGKSNTLAKILREYAALSPGPSKGRVLLFDLNNEYGGDSVVKNSDKVVYELTTRKSSASIPPSSKIPLNFDLLNEDNWCTLLRATQKTQMPVVRRAFRRWQDGITDYCEEIRQMLINKRVLMFHTMREYAGDYFDGIEDLCFNKTTDGFYYPPAAYIDTAGIRPITLKPCDTLNKFLLALVFEIARSSESGTNFDFIQPLIPRAFAIVKDLEKLFVHNPTGSIAGIFKDKVFAVIQLGNVNENTREVLPALLSELVFQDASTLRGSGKPSSITSLVIDEAHNLLHKDTTQPDLIHDNTLRVFEKIVKEGRKYGVYLYIASQRPSDISGTITSQLHNFFIHKLVNPNDIERIRKAVSFMGDSSLSMLTVLGPGECIVSGPSLHLPQYVCVEELDASSKPNSSDIVLFGENGIFNQPKWVF